VPIRIHLRLPLKVLLSLAGSLLIGQIVFPSLALAQATIPTSQDLANAVNEFRASAGMPPLAINASLMQAAQSHSQYQAFIGYLDHKGAGGSNETDRAIAAGYGSGPNIICDEAVAFSSTGADYTTFFTNPDIWGDSEHRDLVFLNTRYTDMGSGLAEKDGKLYYTVDVCVGGSGLGTPATAVPAQLTWTPAGGGTTAHPPTLSPTPGESVPVVTSTPNPDGSLVHVVQRGQTMWHIAIAYGVKVIDLATMNGISPSNPIVYIGQEILVRRAFTPTTSPTITDTSPPSTRTPWPTRTPRPTTVTSTITPTPAPTSPPLFPQVTSISKRTMGIAIIAVCGLGLLFILSLGPKEKK